MDVSLWIRKGILPSLVFCGLLFTLACGNRYDLSTERGRQARIDDAKYHLSKGECDQALADINTLYVYPYIDDEVRIVKASAHACKAGYSALTFVANIAGATNIFQALAKSLTSRVGDIARSEFYTGVDVLTENNGKLSASQRSVEVNNYMIFLQMGVISAILRNYGNPGTDGSQGQNLTYIAGTMSNEDACALAAAFSFINDSMSKSSFSDADTAAVNNSLSSICVAAGAASCSAINRNRSLCDGANAQSVLANTIVNGINGAW